MEAVLNIFLLWVLLPKYAISGYIFTLYVKEIFNTVLSFRRLRKVTCVETGVSQILCMLIAASGAKLITDFTFGSASAFAIFMYLLFFCSIIYITNNLSRDDLKWILKTFRASDLTKFPNIRWKLFVKNPNFMGVWAISKK